MTELEKFTTCDLLKTFDKLGEHLSKAAPDKMKDIITKYGGADMAKKEVAKEAKDYDPNEQTPKTTVEEKNKPPETSVSEDKNAKVAKAGYDGAGAAPGGAPGGEDMSPGTQADVLSQILEALQDMKAMLAQMGEAPAPAPAPGGEVKMGSEKDDDKDEKEVEKDAVAPSAPAPANEKQIASIVVKALDDKFKELGLTKTQKPSAETGHPIQKGTATPSMEQIAKMSWNEVEALNEQNRPKPWFVY